MKLLLLKLKTNSTTRSSFNENVELKNLAASTKLKAEVKGQSPINFKTKEVSVDSRVSAIERITKK